MPRYCLSLTHRKPEASERTGIDLPDEMAAWTEATRACGEMIRDIDGALAVGSDWVMEVSDDGGPLYRIRFSAERLRPSPKDWETSWPARSPSRKDGAG